LADGVVAEAVRAGGDGGPLTVMAKISAPLGKPVPAPEVVYNTLVAVMPGALRDDGITARQPGVEAGNVG